jgi:hypothetical protein
MSSWSAHQYAGSVWSLAFHGELFGMFCVETGVGELQGAVPTGGTVYRGSSVSCGSRQSHGRASHGCGERLRNCYSMSPRQYLQYFLEHIRVTGPSGEVMRTPTLWCDSLAAIDAILFADIEDAPVGTGATPCAGAAGSGGSGGSGGPGGVGGLHGYGADGRSPSGLPGLPGSTVQNGLAGPSGSAGLPG